jgi:hypothetical protein
MVATGQDWDLSSFGVMDGGALLQRAEFRRALTRRRRLAKAWQVSLYAAFALFDLAVLAAGAYGLFELVRWL